MSHPEPPKDSPLPKSASAVDPIDRFYDDLRAMALAESERIKSERNIQERYREEWERAGRPGQLWLWALWKSMNYDMLMPRFEDFQRFYESKSPERIQALRVLADTRFRDLVDRAREAIETPFDTQHLNVEARRKREQIHAGLREFVDRNSERKPDRPDLVKFYLERRARDRERDRGRER